MGQNPKAALICVHNSCRSQIAEALGKLLASDVFDRYSAGTETKPQINQDAVRKRQKKLDKSCIKQPKGLVVCALQAASPFALP